MPLYFASSGLVRKLFYLLMIQFISLYAFCQVKNDTSKSVLLSEVVVKAFAHNRKYQEMPASVAIADSSRLNYYGNLSIVHALNSLPGVRMEERSPGSYRINIRGSSLRAPFGVRNIKIYYNDIPFTDPGGQSYINQMGFYNFGSIEIIKGPGTSMYGAGTGGVMLAESFSRNPDPLAAIEYTRSSYNTDNFFAAVSYVKDRSQHKLSIQHLNSDGYRNHSALKRQVYSWTGRMYLNETSILKTTVLYGDLFYETPGGLTSDEYNLNPRSARPSTGANPSAEEAKASIKQKTIFAGASYQYKPGKNTEHVFIGYGAYTQLRNPTLRNYGKTTEPHAGARTMFTWRDSINLGELSIRIGGEWQEGFATSSIHGNVNGQPDTLQTMDDISFRQRFAFLQGSWTYKNWTVDAGMSVNWYTLEFKRNYPISADVKKKDIGAETGPRLAIGKKINQFFVYSTIAKGFSPPTTFELLPTGSDINLGLKPEDGINMEIGGRASIGKLYIEVSGFRFLLSNAIVQRRDDAGGEFFINAGKTSQSGIESQIIYRLEGYRSSALKGQAWANYAFYKFRYKSFQQLSNDFSGKRIPGVPGHNLAVGADISFKSFYSIFSYIYTSRFALNDNNTVNSNPTSLVHVKIGIVETISQKIGFKLSIGVDNVLDEQYSLGYDLNSAGGRFYNGAPGRNYFVSLGLSWL